MKKSRKTNKSSREREVYLHLFDRANADGFVSASGVGIGKAINLSTTNVSMHLIALERRGEVYRLGPEDDSLSRFAVTALVTRDE